MSSFCNPSNQKIFTVVYNMFIIQSDLHCHWVLAAAEVVSFAVWTHIWSVLGLQACRKRRSSAHILTRWRTIKPRTQEDSDNQFRVQGTDTTPNQQVSSRQKDSIPSHDVVCFQLVLLLHASAVQVVQLQSTKCRPYMQ